ncbi:MAG: enoyl-CoA hydratase/isomerase family protein [Promethearchaeota archaeon]|nr:MAG: enoyl-CoA hydratase/isomerase family protein [Candidatus Lokiarchaeota archaeon]
MKDYKSIKVEEREDGISILIFNRPESLNAINFELTHEMIDYLKNLENNLAIRVVILTGEGRGFSSGLDLKESQIILKPAKKIPEEYPEYLMAKDKIKRNILAQKKLSEVMILLRKIPQPVIAAVNGVAYGGGLGFALASDIRIAGESAKFCNAFINIGVSGADMGSSYWLPRLIGFSRAAEFMYTGRAMDAQEADKIGLVSRVVADNKLLEEAIVLAQQIIGKSPMGVRFTKDALNANVDAQSLESAIKLENRSQVICLNTKDLLEGVFSVLEKRKPNYDEW